MVIPLPNIPKAMPQVYRKIGRAKTPGKEIWRMICGQRVCSTDVEKCRQKKELDGDRFSVVWHQSS